MQRRKFLRLSALGAAMVAVPTTGFASISLKDAAVEAIIREFHYLNLDKKGVEEFVDDFLPYYYWKGNLKYNLAMRTFYVFNIDSQRAVNMFQSTMLRILGETYLLSTDFFTNNMDESRTLKYMGLYSTHLKPCSNPFSHIYYPPAVS